MLQQILFLLICAFNGTANASQPSQVNALKVGEVLKSSSVLINGLKASTGAVVHWGDVIEGSAPASGEVVLYPQASLRLEPGASIKVVGSLIRKDGEQVLAETAVQILRGKIQGQLLKSDDAKTQLKIIGRKSVSSIRGTTFEIATDAPNEVSVFEGLVGVENLTTGKHEEISGDPSLAKPELGSAEVLRASWAKSSAEVMASHRKQAAAAKRLLDKDVRSSVGSLRSDAKKMMKGFEGQYDQFKKK